MISLRRVAVTAAFTGVTIALFVAQSTNIGGVGGLASRWRALTPDAMHSSQFWLLMVLSALCHSSWLHLASNTVAFVPLASVLELRYRSGSLLGFIVLAAPSTSGMQMLVSGHGDIGSSGIVFGLVGWAVVTGALTWKKSRVLAAFVAALLCWFAYCFIANRLFVASFGNASHTTGLLLGLAWGQLTRGRSSARRPSRRPSTKEGRSAAGT